MSDFREASCPVCAAQQPKRRYQITRFSVLTCRECGLIYLWPLLSPEEIREMFERLYSEGEGSVPELKTYYEFCYEDEPSNPLVQLYESWLDAIEKRQPPGRLLDVGCGTGLFLSVARRRGWKPFGIDESREATDHARTHFNLDVRVGEFSELVGEGARFDAITGWDILEHARRPVELLRDMRSCLAENGIVALSTPNQRSMLDIVAGALYWLSAKQMTWPLEKFYIEQHFLYFSPDTFRSTLQRAGLEVESLELESTDLRRLQLSPAMRLILEGLFVMGRVLQRQNRLFALMRASGSSS